MDFVADLPAWQGALLIFFMRVVDVTTGTMRTMAIVEGRLRVSVALGLLEVSVWVLAISQVISRLHENPLLVVGYAFGFATGNAVGILIERRLALGSVVLRIVSREAGPQIARAFRETGQMTTEFAGEGGEGSVRLIFALAPRRDLPRLLTLARSLDRDMFFSVERATQWGTGYEPMLYPTGWRPFWKKK